MGFVVYLSLVALAPGCSRSDAPARPGPEAPSEGALLPTTTAAEAPSLVTTAPPAPQDPCPVWPPPGASAKDALAGLPAEAPRLKLPDGGWVVVRECRWPGGADRNWGARQELVRIAPDSSRLTSIVIGMGRDGGKYWTDKPTLGLGGADPLEVLVRGSYSAISDSDAITVRNLTRHVFLDARADDSVSTSCLPAAGEPSLRKPAWFDEIEGGEIKNLCCTGDEPWSLTGSAKRVDSRCWRIEERWRSPSGTPAQTWGYFACWDAASGGLTRRCEDAPYPPPRAP